MESRIGWEGEGSIKLHAAAQFTAIAESERVGEVEVTGQCGDEAVIGERNVDGGGAGAAGFLNRAIVDQGAVVGAGGEGAIGGDTELAVVVEGFVKLGGARSVLVVSAGSIVLKTANSARIGDE